MKEKMQIKRNCLIGSSFFSASFCSFSVVELGKTAFAGFPETMVQIDTGFLHGPADHVVADVSGAGEEVA